MLQRVRQHLWRTLVGLDQAFSPILTGGSENVTVSANLGAMEVLGTAKRRHRMMRRAVDWLFARLGDHNHCAKQLLWEFCDFPPAERRKLVAVQPHLRAYRCT